jgi:hypothetical protein
MTTLFMLLLAMAKRPISGATDGSMVSALWISHLIWWTRYPHRKHNSVLVPTALPTHAWMKDVLGALTVPILMQYLYFRRRLENWPM